MRLRTGWHLGPLCWWQQRKLLTSIVLGPSLRFFLLIVGQEERGGIDHHETVRGSQQMTEANPDRFGQGQLKLATATTLL